MSPFESNTSSPAKLHRSQVRALDQEVRVIDWDIGAIDHPARPSLPENSKPNPPSAARAHMTRISNRHSASFKTRLIHLKTKEKRFSNRDSPVVFATAPEPVGIGYTESALKKTLSENALRVVREVAGRVHCGQTRTQRWCRNHLSGEQA